MECFRFTEGRACTVHGTEVPFGGPCRPLAIIKGVIYISMWAALPAIVVASSHSGCNWKVSCIVVAFNHSPGARSNRYLFRRPNFLMNAQVGRCNAW